MQSALPVALVMVAVLSKANAGECTHQDDTVFYTNNQYKIRKIDFKSPSDFFFLVRQRLNAIRSRLPIKEGDPFDNDDYDQSFIMVREAVKADSALGKDSPVKITTTTGGLENCEEDASGIKTVDIVYNIFSTDPIPVIQATPEQRETAADQAARAIEQTLVSNYNLSPRFGYDRSRRGFGGLDLSLRIPTFFLDRLELSAFGSSTSRSIQGSLHGSRNPGRETIDHIEYSLIYSSDDVPSLNVRLAKNSLAGSFIGSSKPLDGTAKRLLFRYGAAIEKGIQQTNLPTLSSGYSAVKFYGGLTNTTRYSEAVVSYGVSVAGTGLLNLSYARHIADASYSLRFPGCTNLPWDVTFRATGGGMSGAGMILVNDRFFGGNAVGSLIPGTGWNIPTGPLVRSIPTNRFAGAGLGGTSFYSTNFTVGKVIKGWPLIPVEVESSSGFSDAVNFAENTAENWFADDFEAAAQEFNKLLEDFPPRLNMDLNSAKAVISSIRASGQTSAALDAAIKKAESRITVSKILVETASDTKLRGPDRAERLRGWLTPASALVKLITILENLESLVPAAAPQLKSVKESIKSSLDGLDAGLKRIQTSPAHMAALARAEQVMARPREIIDTLRHEANRYSFSVVGIADIGRLWPDPYGTRFAFGGGGRFSLVNVNLTVTYGVNPRPHRELGQGHGTLLFSITYTNLFR